MESLNAFRHLENKLARLQKDLARKVTFSANWFRQKAKIATRHSRIADLRSDFLHKLMTSSAKNHGLVRLEDLRV